MPGVGGMQHVEDLGATNLADDDAVGTHPQGVADQFAQRDLAPALDVGRPGLETDDVRAGEPKLGGVLDGEAIRLPRPDDRRGSVAPARSPPSGAWPTPTRRRRHARPYPAPRLAERATTALRELIDAAESEAARLADAADRTRPPVELYGLIRALDAWAARLTQET
jgi:hypothetical protein